MNRAEESVRSTFTLELEVDLTDEEWRELGYDPEHITEEDIDALTEKVVELNMNYDIMPLLRHAAQALGKDVVDGEARDETNDS